MVPLAVVAVPISFFLIKRSANTREPENDGPALRFDIAPGMRFLIRFILIALGAFSVLVLVTSLRQGEGWYGVFIPIIVLLAILMATPRAVILDSNGIRQQRWIFGERKIAWHEIAWVRRGWRTGTTYVKSSDGGRPISFSSLLLGKHRFEQEVAKRVPSGAELRE
jgi:hypothetical protein